MNYEINEERRLYLESRGKVILNACPGSGKTTTIAKKIIEIKHSSEVPPYAGIACLSFTNSAKDEINLAYTKLSGDILKFPNHVSTIDSFINRYITLPFYNLLNRNFNRPKVLDRTNILNDMWKVEYVDKKGNTREGLKKPLNDEKYKAKNNRSIYHLYPPSDIRIEPDNSFSIKGNQPSEAKVELNKFNDYCSYIKKKQFVKGLISTGDSAYVALYLLRKNSNIGKWLSSRFPFIIIDEAQDNSTIQHAIFEELLKQGLKNIELIGDPYQSLYEWRDANPNEFLNKYEKDESWQSFNLTSNRRSPQTIIDIFSLIRKKEEPVINSSHKDISEESIIVYKYSEDNHQDIINHYCTICENRNFTENKIVVRGNTLKDKLLGIKSEQRPWGVDLPRNIIEAKDLFLGKDIKNSINEIRSISIDLIYKDFNYHERKEVERKLKLDHEFNSLMFEILQNLPSFDLTITEWTNETQKYFEDCLNLDYKVNFKLRNRKSKYLRKETLNESVDKHFKKSYSKSNIPITTIHQVKGRSLDSILVFFNEKKHVNNILFEDISNTDDAFPSETKRLIYVALSRPKHVLAMAFPSTISNQEIYDRMGTSIHLIEKIN
ncbi:MAG: ATP-dependent helicase [Vicingaceae bacterium]